ncbi:MAG: FkbM family methyltransferase [Magnetococcus sp. DMHC-1]|nr:FkbM family methyltransferase [Magnetococcales bacterium]
MAMTDPSTSPKNAAFTMHQQQFICGIDNPLYEKFWNRVNRGQWEPETLQTFDTCLNENMVTVDIGAWIGPTTLYASRKCRKVYAFEPDAVAFAELKKNVANNNIENVELFNLAIDFQKSDRCLYKKTAFGDSMSSFIDVAGAAEFQKISSDRLDNLVAADVLAGDVFYKIDIEGYEYDLMPKLAYLFNNKKCILYLSVHPMILAGVAKGNRLLRSWNTAKKTLALRKALPFDQCSRSNIQLFYDIFMGVLFRRHWKLDNMSLLLSHGRGGR